MSIVISPAIRRELRACADRAAPMECCGALLTRTASVESISIDETVDIPNRAISPRRAFLIDARTLRRLENAAGTRALSVVGFYHSHPGGVASPSTTDLASAWPWYRYVIIGDTGMQAWRLRADRSAFEREELLVERAMCRSAGSVGAAA